MHMADALVTPAVAGTMYACSAAVSFPKYDLIGLLGMAVYLIAWFLLAELSFGKCLRRLRVVLPLVCMVGLNMDYSGTIRVGEYPVSKQYLPQLLFMVYQEIFCRWLSQTGNELDERPIIDIYRKIEEDGYMEIDICFPLKTK